MKCILFAANKVMLEQVPFISTYMLTLRSAYSHSHLTHCWVQAVNQCTMMQTNTVDERKSINYNEYKLASIW